MSFRNFFFFFFFFAAGFSGVASGSSSAASSATASSAASSASAAAPVLAPAQSKRKAPPAASIRPLIVPVREDDPGGEVEGERFALEPEVEVAGRLLPAHALQGTVTDVRGEAPGHLTSLVDRDGDGEDAVVVVLDPFAFGLAAPLASERHVGRGHDERDPLCDLRRSLVVGTGLLVPGLEGGRSVERHQVDPLVAAVLGHPEGAVVGADVEHVLVEGDSTRATAAPRSVAVISGEMGRWRDPFSTERNTWLPAL